MGICHNHKSYLNSFTFDTYLSIADLQESLQQNKIHLAREDLVITVSKVGKDDIIPKPILVAPIRCLSNDDLVTEVVSSIVKSFAKYNSNSTLLNIATDGDANRRALNRQRKPNHSIMVLKDLVRAEFGFW